MKHISDQDNLIYHIIKQTKVLGVGTLIIGKVSSIIGNIISIYVAIYIYIYIYIYTVNTHCPMVSVSSL